MCAFLQSGPSSVLEDHQGPGAAELKQRQVGALAPGEPALPGQAHSPGWRPPLCSAAHGRRPGEVPLRRGTRGRPDPRGGTWTSSSEPGSKGGLRAHAVSCPGGPAARAPLHSPSLVKVHEEHHVVPEACQPVGRGHGDDEGKDVVDEGVEGLQAGRGRKERGRWLLPKTPAPCTAPFTPIKDGRALLCRHHV